MLKVLGGEQEGEFKAVASGTLPNGKPVIVNADGTVSVAGEESYSESLGSATVFETGSTTQTAATFDSSNNKVVIAYRDNGNSNYGTAVVGTVSGDTISFGTPVVFQNSAIQETIISYDSGNSKVVIAYINNGNSYYGTAIVGTVSGTSISFGTSVVFSSYYSSNGSITYDSTSGKIIIANKDGTTTDDCLAYVGTVSGTSISFGSAQTVDNGNVDTIRIIYDASVDRVIFAYEASAVLYTKVGTVSGSTITFGSAQSHFSGNHSNIRLAHNNNGTLVVSFEDNTSASDPLKAFAATIGTSSITKGTTVTVDSNSVEHDLVYDSFVDKFLILYRVNTPSNQGRYIYGSASGTTLTFESSVTYFTGGAEQVSLAFDTNANKSVFVYQDQNNSNQGTSRTLQGAGSVTNLTAENYIGMSRGVVDSVAEETGTATVFEASNIASSSAAFDSNSDKIVIAYKDQGNSNYGTAVVGTVSGTSISFGTPVVFETATVFMQPQAVTYDSVNNKVVISYTDNGNSNYGTAVVGTVSGTSISFGTPVVFETASAGKVQSIFDSANSKVVVCYDDGGNADYITAVVGTVSGTSISFGTPVVAHAAAVDWNSITYDSNEQKVVIAYRNRDNSDYGTAVVGTVSGTSISFGTPVVFESNFVEYTAPAFDTTNNKVVIAYRNNGNSNHGTAIVGTVSGTSISFGTAVVFNESTTNNNSAVFDSNSNKIIISYRDEGNSSYGTFITGSVSGDTINFDTPTVFEAASTSQISSTFDSVSNKVIISYEDIGNSNYGTGIVVQPSYVTRGEVADTNPASMDIIGSVSDNQLSLTAGEKYYVQTDGTLSTTAGSPSVLAGTAISSTELLVKT